jgi:hypothetical protein
MHNVTFVNKANFLKVYKCQSGGSSQQMQNLRGGGHMGVCDTSQSTNHLDWQGESSELTGNKIF